MPFKRNKRNGGALLFFLGLALLAWVYGLPQALRRTEPQNAAPARVVAVSDGDSMIVSLEGRQEKIRLYGIDAPENGQPGGREAREFTSALVMRSAVRIEEQYSDQFGRGVVMLTLPDGRLLNAELARAGHAWVYAQYCKSPLCEEWKRLENTARRERLGLWRENGPTPPWSWRKRHPRRD